MRLNKKDIEIIKRTILDYLSDAKIYLFGSRVDDSKKGGDIDLIIETKYSIELRDELKLLCDLELNGIERKIDLLIVTPLKKHTKMLESIKDKRIAL